MIEKLAALAHEQWSGWMKYLFRFGVENPDGSFTMDADQVARWKRQMSTTYADLLESEKASDRTEAEKVLLTMYENHIPVLCIRQDGDQFFAALPDFVNLQESPVVWVDPGPIKNILCARRKFTDETLRLELE